MKSRLKQSENSLATAQNLTSIEAKIVRLLADGFQRKEIVQQLNVSISTVKFHLENAYRKLGVHSQAAAVAGFLVDSEVTGNGKLR